MAAEAVGNGIRLKKEAEQARKDRSREQKTDNENLPPPSDNGAYAYTPALATTPDERAREQISAAQKLYRDGGEGTANLSPLEIVPTQRASLRKDAAPSASSKLRHTRTHDSGYGSSSSPYVPEMREQSAPRQARLPSKSSTKYRSVDPHDSIEAILRGSTRTRGDSAGDKIEAILRGSSRPRRRHDPSPTRKLQGA